MSKVSTPLARQDALDSSWSHTSQTPPSYALFCRTKNALTILDEDELLLEHRMVGVEGTAQAQAYGIIWPWLLKVLVLTVHRRHNETATEEAYGCLNLPGYCLIYSKVFCCQDSHLKNLKLELRAFDVDECRQRIVARLRGGGKRDIWPAEMPRLGGNKNRMAADSINSEMRFHLHGCSYVVFCWCFSISTCAQSSIVHDRKNHFKTRQARSSQTL